MLELRNITKKYLAGDTLTTALNEVSLTFGENEFVAILGTSGSGKTTLLNVVGGLDRYDDGDLIINGVSTKEYKDRNWDAYRNHSIGFVFQSYNLIPHQTVLSNVELALTLSGVPKAERKRRAKEALEKVGLGNQLYKKPSQMSGGQMQRVAIARALVNDPEIILADEPTGALDTETSVQIMELLREVASDRLVIMVTHNPELADTYATRIVRLQDGKVLSDEANIPTAGQVDKPIAEQPQKAAPKTEIKSSKTSKKKTKSGKTSMSFFTALSLSLNNLMTKKGRTLLTSFAGSIGIIGIALILAISNGINLYIDQVQEDALSSYPITIQAENVDLSEMLSLFMGRMETTEHELDKVYSSSQMQDMFNSLLSVDTTSNNLTDFKKHLEENPEFDKVVSAVQYGYGLDLLIYGYDLDDNFITVNPSAVVQAMQSAMGVSYDSDSPAASYSSSPMWGMQVWSEMMPGASGELINPLVKDQYDLLAGAWPTSYDQIVLVVSENNELSDVYLYSLGLRDQSEIADAMSAVMSGEPLETYENSWEYDDLLDLMFYAVLPTDYYTDSDNDGVWTDMRDNEEYMKIIAENGLKLKIAGIVRPNEDATATSIAGAVGYTSALTEYLIDQTNESSIVTQQKEDPATDVFTGLPFDDGSNEEPTPEEKAAALREYVASLSTADKSALYQQIAAVMSDEELAQAAENAMAAYPDRASIEQVVLDAYVQSSGADIQTVQNYLASMSDEELKELMRMREEEQIAAQYAQQVSAALTGMTVEQLAAALDAQLADAAVDQLADLYDSYMPATVSESTYEENLTALCAVDLNTPTSINIYASTFEAKDQIADLIAEYNKTVDEEDQIVYTDYIALLLSSITTIINAISYVLIAFVSISLVVSSIMIGIITYISVLERTKEIGILRSIGASKKDVSRVFTAETLIVGLAAGLIGIGITLLLCIPANIIIKALTDISGVATLPWLGGVILIIISMVLTLISGTIPSRLAAKKDPVTALRSE